MQEPFYKSNKMTSTLEMMIASVRTFEEFERKYSEEFLNDDDRISSYVRQLMDIYDAKAKPTSRAAGLDETYITRLINGNIKNPSRDSLIAICLALKTSVEEVQYLLRYAGYSPLYVRRKRDVIIWFGFMKHRSASIINIDLEERGFELLPVLKEKDENSEKGD